MSNGFNCLKMMLRRHLVGLFNAIIKDWVTVAEVSVHDETTDDYHRQDRPQHTQAEVDGTVQFRKVMFISTYKN